VRIWSELLLNSNVAVKVVSCVQEAVLRMQWNILKTEHSKNEETNEEDLVGLSNLVLGPPIAKGCSAVVYAARKKQGTSKT
jgi:hypothetical protein